MNVTSRPIRWTSRIDAHRPLWAALGLVTVVDTGGWVELASATGRVALHAVEAGDPRDGTTSLAVVADDVEEVASALTAAGHLVERTHEAHGDGLRVALADGQVLLVDHAVPDEHGPALDEPRAASAASPTPEPGSVPAATGAPVTGHLWYTGDVALAAGVHDLLGAVRHSWGDRGGWVDSRFPDGTLAQVHESHAGRADLAVALEHPDLDALRAAVRDAWDGRADLVDESYGRSLRLADPDGGDDLWVNEVQTDFYGFGRADGAVAG